MSPELMRWLNTALHRMSCVCMERDEHKCSFKGSNVRSWGLYWPYIDDMTWNGFGTSISWNFSLLEERAVWLSRGHVGPWVHMLWVLISVKLVRTACTVPSMHVHSNVCVSAELSMVLLIHIHIRIQVMTVTMSVSMMVKMANCMRPLSLGLCHSSSSATSMVWCFPENCMYIYISIVNVSLTHPFMWAQHLIRASDRSSFGHKPPSFWQGPWACHRRLSGVTASHGRKRTRTTRRDFVCNLQLILVAEPVKVWRAGLLPWWREVHVLEGTNNLLDKDLAILLQFLTCQTLLKLPEVPSGD